MAVKACAFDHIVLVVADVAQTVAFYQRVLGMEPREERKGKWSLHFGSNKISLQADGAAPEIARRTTPGTGNFCVLAEGPIEAVAAHLEQAGVELVLGPGLRDGGAGPIQSVYFNDPDGNLVEVAVPM